MNVLEMFVKNLCGVFNNDKQIHKQKQEGNLTHPKAKHINGIANDKIINLPKDFKGYFIIEESYYEMGERKNILPHLFLFELNENNQVVLKSYEIPNNISKADFRNDNLDLKLDYNTLEESNKFTPMIYFEKDGVFEGESVSYFSKEVKFVLKERIEKDTLDVSEVFYKNSKITFGFVDPIIYNRVN